MVYDDQAATWLKGATLGEEQLKKSISISQSVDDPSAARIEFDHPRSFNDELLGTSFNPGESPVTFFTQDRNGQRDGPIELPPEAYQVDPIRGDITYDLNLFPETPAYAVGSMPQYLATVDQQTYDARQLPKGLELKGNALVVDLKLFPAQDWRFFRQGRQWQLSEGDSFGQSRRERARPGVIRSALLLWPAHTSGNLSANQPHHRAIWI